MSAFMLLVVAFFATLALSYVLPENMAKTLASVGAYCFMGAILVSIIYVAARAVDRIRSRKAGQRG